MFASVLTNEKFFHDGTTLLCNAKCQYLLLAVTKPGEVLIMVLLKPVEKQKLNVKLEPEIRNQ